MSSYRKCFHCPHQQLSESLTKARCGHPDAPKRRAWECPFTMEPHDECPLHMKPRERYARA